MTNVPAPITIQLDSEHIGDAVLKAATRATAGGSASLNLVEASALDPRQLPLLHAHNDVDFGSILHKLPHKIPHIPKNEPSVIGPFSTGSVTFNNGVPVGGWVTLELHSDGTCLFSGHFHDSGAPSVALL